MKYLIFLTRIQSGFFKNLFSVGLASVISRLISLVILGYPARILGPENYGLYTLGLSITAYGSIFILPGLNTWGSRKVAISNSNIDRTLIVVNLTRLVLALISYSLIILYVSFFIDNQITRLVVLICALNLFSLALSTEWIFNGLELMRIPAFVGLIISFLNVIFIYLLIKTPHDLILYSFFIPSFTFITNILLLFLLVKRGVKFKFPTFNYYKLSLKSSFYLSITSSIAIIIHYANNFIVNYYGNIVCFFHFLLFLNIFYSISFCYCCNKTSFRIRHKF
jgi:O-antigen/teichoic acid export membrane protein